jgi:hypothetical protein
LYLAGWFVARGAWQTGARRTKMRLNMLVVMVALALATVAGQSVFI